MRARLIDIETLRKVQQWRAAQWPCRDETLIDNRGACLRCCALKGEVCMRGPVYVYKKAGHGDEPRPA